ncbi:MAG: hypothetical protein EOO38_20560, partial [Cytophagaceae bacterium]
GMGRATALPFPPLKSTPLPAMRGDGVADDTEALQKALDMYKSVALEAGNYRITRPLRLSAGSSLTGPGTIIVDFDSAKMDDSNAALYGQGQDIRIEGITIAKRFRDGSYGVGVLIAAGSQNIIVRNVEIRGYSARYGIHIIESENFEITGCYIHDFLMDGNADMILDSPAGVRVTRCTNGIISNNRILRIEVGAKGYASISPERTAYGRQGYQSDCLTVMQCRAVTIVGNVLATSGEGLDLLLSQECTVSANSVRNIWFQGIKMLGVRYSTVTGNALRDCFQGIGLAGHSEQKTDCVGNTVMGNTILDAGAPGQFRVASQERKSLGKDRAFGIDLSGRCLDNTVVYNTILDTQSEKTMALPIHQDEKLHNIVENS